MLWGGEELPDMHAERFQPGTTVRVFFCRLYQGTQGEQATNTLLQDLA